MRFYWPIAKVDATSRMVWGYASTEAVDEQGEIVKRDALAAALDEYMRFANIREMHRPSAVGIATEAVVDDTGLYLGAKIVDDGAWQKVVEGVYKGFSIGGRVTARDSGDRKQITGLRLTEISVVDRPANPEAVFDCWKLSAAGPGEPTASSAPEGQRDPTQRKALRDYLGELCDLLGTLVGQAETAGPQLAAAATSDSLRKVLEPDPTALVESVAKLAGDILPRLDALQKRVEDIARTPLPAQTIARGYTALTKQEDGGGSLPHADDIVAALARMNEEERTLALIKAARANPIAASGRTAASGMR